MRDVNNVPFQSPRPKRLILVGHRTLVSHILVSHDPTIYLILFRSLMTGLWLMSPIFPKSVVLVLLFLMSISVLKIMISLTLLWVSWYLLVTRLFRLLLIPDQSVWSKTENLLRNASHVLGTAEHFLSAVAPLLKD
jgi:hypothetical protein